MRNHSSSIWNPDDIFSVIGFTLTYLQSFERSIKFCTTFVLQGDGDLTWGRLQDIEKEERKKALGYFILEIRKRVQLHDRFDELISSVLRDRNDFVHNTDKIAGWDLRTPEGVAVARSFCMSLVRRAHTLNEIFATLFAQWSEQAKIRAGTTTEQDTYFAEIQRRYGHLIGLLFVGKS